MELSRALSAASWNGTGGMSASDTDIVVATENVGGKSVAYK